MAIVPCRPLSAMPCCGLWWSTVTAADHSLTSSIYYLELVSYFTSHLWQYILFKDSRRVIVLMRHATSSELEAIR